MGLPNSVLNPWMLTRDKLERIGSDDQRQFKDILDVILNLDRNLNILSKLNSISRGFVSRTVTIGTTPTLIHSSARAVGILLFNPTLSAGLTTSGTIFSSALRTPATYTTRATPLAVANYEQLTLFLDITVSVAGSTLVIDVESEDQLSLGWMGTQADVFSGIRAVRANGDMGYHSRIGPLGVDVNFAVEAIVGTADITFSLGYTLKAGLPGTSAGVASTVYLGSSDGVSTSSGFPVFSGDKLPLVVSENTELWGVALAAGQTIRVFELS